MQKLLIANRGEIAVRIIKTARRMKLATVAVYSQADARSLPVQLADEAVCIGPAAAAKSYLNIEAIVAACRTSGADAVHPGYGFLSENALFAERMQQEGITFVGPAAAAIANMGDKIAAKKLAIQAGLQTIPGCERAIRNAEEAAQIGGKLGYPVLLKAAAGGGGNGIARAEDDASCRSEFEKVSRQAKAHFGDDRIFIEKLLQQPRHIEIQILADRQGNVIHLGERECSLQRRRQKVIEESPSPFVNAKLREKMGSQAVALAKAANYESAGTVEFLVDADRNVYFLEMNTRLQVEHPVTEMATGLDLVEWMLRIAAGETLAIRQSDVKLSGSAIEARIYAEDPARNFMPSAGRLIRYLPPPETENVRIDSGVTEGSEIPLHYDPLIAKLITRGTNRREALSEMNSSLSEFIIKGVDHNIGFLAALANDAKVRAGNISTSFIEEKFIAEFGENDSPEIEELFLVAVAGVHFREEERAACISGQLSGNAYAAPQDWVVVGPEKLYPICVSACAGGYEVVYNAKAIHLLTDWRPGQPLLRGSIHGNSFCLQVDRKENTYRLSGQGVQRDFQIFPARAAALFQFMPRKKQLENASVLRSPMPGLLMELTVAEGETVKAGQVLAVVEAMKMENRLRAEQNGVIGKIMVSVGSTLAADQIILEFQ